MLKMDDISPIWCSDHFHPASLNNTTQPAPRRRLASNLTRRSHHKSRNGCLTCKRRKIKCGEEHPICQNCTIKDLLCAFPSIGKNTTRSSGNIIRPTAPMANLSLAGQTRFFSMTDMRYFHHFLTAAYPHLPVGNETVWVREVPQIAQSEQYLMHAMLGLSASHLWWLNQQQEFYTSALAHRGHALVGLNRALAKEDLGPGEADSMLAAIYSLTMQATYMSLEMNDFIVMVKGCQLVTDKVQQSRQSIAFNLEPDSWHCPFEPGIKLMPPFEPGVIQAGIAGLNQVIPMLETNLEYDYHAAIESTLKACLISPKDGFFRFADTFPIWYHASSEDFNKLLEPDNVTAHILSSHFVAIMSLMAPVSEPIYQQPQRMMSSRFDGAAIMAVTAESLFRKVPDALQNHISWPKTIIERSKKNKIEEFPSLFEEQPTFLTAQPALDPGLF